jgi:two-component system NtrC family sensor kinase
MTLRANLTTKFIVAALAIVSGVLTGSAAVAVARERALFERDMTHDAQSFARSLAVPLLHAFRAQGEGGARELLAQVQAQQDQAAGMHVAWQPLEALAPAAAAISGALHGPLAATSFREEHTPPGELVTFVRVDAPRAGVLVVRESLADEHRYIGASVRNHVITTTLLLALAAAGMWIVGRHFVGRPVDLLVAKARRAGSGDLSGPVLLSQRDELRELADEMNQMCEKLDESRRHLEAETVARVAAVDQLRHAERVATVGRLASGVAHELGTPLNVVLGRASVIRGARTPEEIAQHAAIIERQVTRMSRIIRGLLDFARSTPPRRGKVEASKVTRATAQMLLPMAEKAGLQLDVEEPGDGVALTGDEGQLQQVLTNLVLNGIQAGQPGGHVRIGCHTLPAGAVPPGPAGETVSGPAVVFTVSDDGAGMSEDVRRRIFEPFFTTKDVGQGTGLGLAVSYGIVREHGGYIDVASAPEHGARFSVFLPYQAASSAVAASPG